VVKRPSRLTRPSEGYTAAGAKYITQYCCPGAGPPAHLPGPLPFIILTFIQQFAALIKPDAALTYSYRLPTITDPPTVSVHLANEDPSRLVTRAEGQNVTFKCRADARPPVTSYSWFKNVSKTTDLSWLPTLIKKQIKSLQLW